MTSLAHAPSLQLCMRCKGVWLVSWAPINRLSFAEVFYTRDLHPSDAFPFIGGTRMPGSARVDVSCAHARRSISLVQHVYAH